MFNQSFLIEWAEQNLLPFMLILTWCMIWKGIALWKAAHNNHQKWFIALFITNTLGLLEIVYIYVFSKKKPANNHNSII